LPNKETDEYITVSSIDMGGEAFIIFANCDLTKLISIIVVRSGRKHYFDPIGNQGINPSPNE
jgi:hypothetical protein